MSQITQTVDVTHPVGLTNFLMGMLDHGEWKTLLMTLALAFAITYTLKVIYHSFINENKKRSNHIRLLALISGMASPYMIWPAGALSMQWYVAGFMVGPLSIFVHHALIGFAKSKKGKILVPWLYPIIKGEKDRRKIKR